MSTGKTLNGEFFCTAWARCGEAQVVGPFSLRKTCRRTAADAGEAASCALRKQRRKGEKKGREAGRFAGERSTRAGTGRRSVRAAPAPWRRGRGFAPCAGELRACTRPVRARFPLLCGGGILLSGAEWCPCSLPRGASVPCFFCRAQKKERPETLLSRRSERVSPCSFLLRAAFFPPPHGGPDAAPCPPWTWAARRGIQRCAAPCRMRAWCGRRPRARKR